MSDHLPYRGNDEAETTGIGLAPSAMATAEAVGIGIGDTIPEGPPDAEHKRKLGIAAWIAITWLVVMLLLAILAPVLPIPDPTETFPEIARQGPSSGHLLGGDALGRDLLSRIIWGGRASFAVGFGAVAVGLAVGIVSIMFYNHIQGKVEKMVSEMQAASTELLDTILSQTGAKRHEFANK